ncbi:MAG: FKBP-type peptidyl-prolyl cis-trans isomerase [Bacteroidia bacterium]|jgi:FKBP-type peptidyl-prolyl cis-trans isomerase|nr:FKBP-type peptidyl-prolyl cis-trans isomerase [Bacteroidia bacterium]
MRAILVYAMLLIISVPACGQSLPDGFEKTQSGLVYKFHRKTPGLPPARVNDIVTANMRYYIDDSLLFDSRYLGRELLFPLMEPAFKGDFYEGVLMMSAGDSASFICRADSIFKRMFMVRELPAFVKPKSVVRFDIGMVRFQSQEAYERERQEAMQAMIAQSNEALEEYIANKGITVKPTASGLYYVEQKKGTGQTPRQGQAIKVHYKGTLLDGTKFDSSYDRGQPFEFTLGMGQVIKGWDEGIALMQEGGKAILILPQHLAYGERQAGSIPPFSPLVFEVELIEIVK